MNILARLVHRLVPRQPIALPAAPSAPASRADEWNMDGWVNPSTGLGTRRDRSTCNTFVGRVQRSDEERQAVYEHSALMARYIDLSPNICMAKGFQVSELSGDDATLFEAEMVRLQAFRKFADAGRWARLYGGAIIFMMIPDGKKHSEPVDESMIVGIKNLVVFTRRELSVVKWCEDLGSDNYGMPEIYRVSSFGKTFEVHFSRVLRFDGVKVDRYSLRYGTDGFGPSCVDQVWDAFEQYGTTHAYLNGAVSKVTQGVLKINGLNEGGKGAYWQKLANRLKIILQSMSVIGDIVVDSNGGEDYTMVERPMTGFSEASALSEARLVGEMGVPKSILMMQAPGGLANGENGGDWKYMSISCGSEQQQTYEPPVKQLVKFMFLSRNSPVIDPPQKFTITWPPILQMSELEKATIYSQRAPGRSSDVLAGIISAMEARNSDDVIDAYHLDAQDGSDEDFEAEESAPGIQPPVPPELRVVGT